MADVPEINEWVDGVRQLETTDPAQGGAGGIMNRQAEQLASRTTFLRWRQAIWSGPSTFTSADFINLENAYIVLAQNFGADNYTVEVVPLEDSEGSLGEVWLEKLPEEGEVHVHRSGEYEGPVQITVFATTNDTWS